LSRPRRRRHRPAPPRSWRVGGLVTRSRARHQQCSPLPAANETDDLAKDRITGGGRLAACAIGDLARLAAIATPRFAIVIGQVAAQRALELVWTERAPLRGFDDLEAALRPLVLAGRQSARAAQALEAARAYASGTGQRRRRA